MEDDVYFLIDSINKRKDKRGRKPSWFHEIVKNVYDINNFKEISSFLENNPSFINDVKNKISKSGIKRVYTLKLFWKFRNCIDKKECNKTLFQEIIEYPEIYENNEVMSLILQFMNGFSMTDNDFNNIKIFLHDLKLAK